MGVCVHCVSCLQNLQITGKSSLRRAREAYKPRSSWKRRPPESQGHPVELCHLGPTKHRRAAQPVARPVHGPPMRKIHGCVVLHTQAKETVLALAIVDQMLQDREGFQFYTSQLAPHRRAAHPTLRHRQLVTARLPVSGGQAQPFVSVQGEVHQPRASKQKLRGAVVQSVFNRVRVSLVDHLSVLLRGPLAKTSGSMKAARA